MFEIRNIYFQKRTAKSLQAGIVTRSCATHVYACIKKESNVVKIVVNIAAVAYSATSSWEAYNFRNVYLLYNNKEWSIIV